MTWCLVLHSIALEHCLVLHCMYCTALHCFHLVLHGALYFIALSWCCIALLCFAALHCVALHDALMDCYFSMDSATTVLVVHAEKCYFLLCSQQWLLNIERKQYMKLT